MTATVEELLFNAGSQWESEANRLRAENESLRAALADFAEFGIRGQTNPVVHTADAEAMQSGYVRYIMSIDQSVRARAKTALGWE